MIRRYMAGYSFTISLMCVLLFAHLLHLNPKLSAGACMVAIVYILGASVWFGAGVINALHVLRPPQGRSGRGAADEAS